MAIVRFFCWTILCCSVPLCCQAYASDSYAGKLNEFVLDGTESCVEIKKGSSSIRPELAAVTNAASYGNRIAPGGLAVLWGARFSEIGEEYIATKTPLSRLLGRVQVLWRAADWDTTVFGSKNRCGWRAAPLLYVGPNQINFQSVSIHICTGSDNADRCSERGMSFPYRLP